MQKSRTVDHGRDDVVCGNFGESFALSTSLKRLIIENQEKFLDSSIMAIYRRRWDMVDQVLERFRLPVQALSVLASVYSSPKIRLTRNQALDLFRSPVRALSVSTRRWKSDLPDIHLKNVLNCRFEL